MNNLFKPLWLILSGDNEVVVVGGRNEAITEAKRLFRDSFSITLLPRIA